MSKNEKKPELVLASSSPFRRQLLAQLQVPFKVVIPDIDETPRAQEEPQGLVERLAIEKAQVVGVNLPDSLIIGSDQVASYDGEIVGKPGDRATAIEQLLGASGQTVRLYTGVALLNSNSGVIRSRVIPYEVVFRDITLAMIEGYLEREEPYGCCGSLQADGLGVALLARISGDDPSALIGLPLITVIDLLAQENYPIL
ncbi:MAG TPA: septum formation inhibitor Maf [Gammaproteobacteria bacterium]|nr:septum formation inhibitor Maf [Gammaproteobacteria bacterium]